jgi:hypothetical protein
MVQKSGRKKLLTALAVVGALLLIVMVIVVAKAMSNNDSSVPIQTTTQDTPAVNDDTDASKTDEPVTVKPETPTEQPAIDPEKVAQVTIEPMSITVSYMKGIGGFDYEVLRTGSGTKYVEFSSTKLAGTKCTNDEGQFASIIEKPSADEAATLSKTTTVEGIEYGLSLADSTCTSDSALLKQYQDAFSGAFSLLKKM